MKNEDQLQAAAIQWARNTYPEIRRLIWAVPNGGERNVVEGALKVATGMLEGVWDVHLFYRNQLHIFEFKWGANPLTKDRITKSGAKKYGQYEWGNIMKEQGAKLHVIRGTDDNNGELGLNVFKNIINAILRPAL